MGYICMSDVDYISGVGETTNKPITFLDPNNLTSSNPHSAANITAMRNSLNSQHAGFGTRLSENDIKHLIDRALTRSPSAISHQVPGHLLDPNAQQGQTIDSCLIVKQDSHSDSMQDIVHIASGTPINLLKPIPGTEAVWDKALGVHEGRHCVDPTPTTIIGILEAETNGDSEAIQWLRNNGQDVVADALIDYRILGSVHKNDIVHANGFALQLGGQAAITTDYLKAAGSIRPEVLSVIRDEHDLGSLSNAEQYINKFPERCIKTVETALLNGEFQNPNNPDLELHIHAYTQAFRRQMNGVTPLVASANLDEITNGHANVKLNNDGGATMTIGGVSASDFFASVSDPDLAQERISRQDVQTEIGPEALVTNAEQPSALSIGLT